MTREQEISDRLLELDTMLREASNAYHRATHDVIEEKEALIQERTTTDLAVLQQEIAVNYR